MNNDEWMFGCQLMNQSVEKDLQMLKDLGLDPSWDKHGFSDQPEPACGGAVGE